jgi:hypothetical protein
MIDDNEVRRVRHGPQILGKNSPSRKLHLVIAYGVHQFKSSVDYLPGVQHVGSNSYTVPDKNSERRGRHIDTLSTLSVRPKVRI